MDSQHWRYHLLLENTQRLITEVLSGAISIKAARDAITEYDVELPKTIKSLKFQLLGLQSFRSSNNESAIDNKPDVTSLPPADSGEKDNDPYMPPLNPECIVKE